MGSARMAEVAHWEGEQALPCCACAAPDWPNTSFEHCNVLQFPSPCTHLLPPVKLVRVEVSLGAGGACRRRRAAPPPLLPPAALATAPWKGPASISASNGAARRTSSGASISPMSNGLKSAASSFLMAAWSGRRMAAKGFSVELGVNLLPEALGCKEVQPEKLPRWRGLSSKVDFTMQVW